MTDTDDWKEDLINSLEATEAHLTIQNALLKKYADKMAGILNKIWDEDGLSLEQSETVEDYYIFFPKEKK